MDHFEQQDVAYLEQRGEITQASPSGDRTRRISRRRFENSSDETDTSNPSVFSAGSVISASTTEAFEFVAVPEKLHSEATFITLGFQNDTAVILYQRYLALLPTQRHEDDLLYIAYDHVETHGQNAFDRNDNWQACLSMFGISDDLSLAIRNPTFPNLQYAESAVWHCKDAFGMRWRAIKHAAQLSQERSLRYNARPVQPSSSTPTSTPARDAFTHDIGSGHVFVGHHVFVENMTAEQQERELGSITLWKCTDRARAERLFGSGLPPGNFELQPIISSPPSDFHGRTALYYFSATSEGAQHYARYQKPKAGLAGICVISLTIPKHVISSASPFVMQHHSDLWKKTVWFSRNGKPLKGNVDEVIGKELLVGAPSTGTLAAWSRIPHWSNVSNSNVVFLEDGTVMVQYVFGETFEAKVLEHCQGALTLHHHETLARLS